MRFERLMMVLFGCVFAIMVGWYMYLGKVAMDENVELKIRVAELERTVKSAEEQVGRWSVGYNEQYAELMAMKGIKVSKPR